MLFMGDSALSDGFRLIGFEALADPTPKAVDTLVRELVNNRCNAFLVIDQALADAGIHILEQVRAEGGHIVIATVPPLNDPGKFRTRIDERLRMMLGGVAT